ncbi:MAG: hypothetical protein ABIW15_12550 [Ferruginibacter sp.]
MDSHPFAVERKGFYKFKKFFWAGVSPIAHFLCWEDPGETENFIEADAYFLGMIISIL